MSQKDDRSIAFVSAYAAMFETLATAVTGRASRGPQGAVLAITGAAIAPLNAMISPSLEPSADEITALAAAGSPWDFPWSIHVRGVPSPMVAEAAARHGLTRFERQPLMIRHCDQGLPKEPVVDGLRIRAVPRDELDLYARTVAEGFEVPYEMLRVFADPSLATVDGMTFYLAELDGVPVGTGMTATSGDLTGIFNIATLPGHRRRGFASAVTLELVRSGFAAGAGTAYLYASEKGESVYRSVGFRTEEYLTVISAPS
ncbi:GNAT family N-acetyltransferase [Streptomyces sp. NPDC088732]|uniref:GNAT family N-acetyltransferase n=1 Tax=Streptomyces sp. NPDC088732 TaxID=3365879 RepID=UPI0038072DD2